MGVDTIETLSRIPPEMVEKVLGKNGHRGVEESQRDRPHPVKPYSERKSIGSETTFESDTIDVAQYPPADLRARWNGWLSTCGRSRSSPPASR